MCNILSNKCYECKHIDTDKCSGQIPKCDKCTYFTLIEDDIAHKHFCEDCRAMPLSTKCYFMPKEKLRNICLRCNLRYKCIPTDKKPSCDKCSNKDSMFCDICRSTKHDENNICLFDSKDK